MANAQAPQNPATEAKQDPVIQNWVQKAKDAMEEGHPTLYRKLKKKGELKQYLNLLGKSAAETEQHSLERLNETETPEKAYRTKNPSAQERATQALMNETTAREMADEQLGMMITALEEEYLG